MFEALSIQEVAMRLGQERHFSDLELLLYASMAGPFA
jgi:hypothetical protein